MDEGSGNRASTLLAFGDSVQGIRTQPERFLAEYALKTGASKPGMSLLYEFVDGLVKAFSDLACFKIPPINHKASSDKSAYLSPANKGLPSFQIDILQCIPVPLSPAIGFGMNVADLPYA